MDDLAERDKANLAINGADLQFSEPGTIDWKWLDPPKFSQQEWVAIVEQDEVLSFMKRVNDRAVADPEWHRDFRKATEIALQNEYIDYACKKYNEGHPFSIGPMEPTRPTKAIESDLKPFSSATSEASASDKPLARVQVHQVDNQ